MKKLKFLFLFSALVLTFTINGKVFAEENIAIFINGEKQIFDQTPRIIKGTTLVPMRGIFEELGATVEWYGQTKTIIGKKGELEVLLKVGSNTAIVNKEPKVLAVPVQIMNSRAMVPLRLISESLGAQVTWNDSIRRVDINTLTHD